MQNKGDKLFIRKCFLVIKLTLALVLMFTIIRTVSIQQQTGEIFGPVPATGTENITQVKAAGWAGASLNDYSAIIKRNLFAGVGSPRRQNKTLNGLEIQGSIQSAEEELGLTLLGTVSGNPAVARAVIKDNESNTTNLYETGDIVASAFIESIEKDKVILLHQGKRKILSLNRSQSVGKVGENDNAQAPTDQTINLKNKVVKNNPPDEQTPKRLRTKMSLVESILQGAIIRPFAVNGKTEGLKITGIENIPAAKYIGLKNGDIVRFVNGQQLTGLQRAFQVFRKARSLPTMDIELLRNGQIKELSFDLQ